MHNTLDGHMYDILEGVTKFEDFLYNAFPLSSIVGIYGCSLLSLLVYMDVVRLVHP